MIERIAARLKVPPAQVRVSTPFLEFGMGSVDAVEMAAELEHRLGRRLSPTAVYNYPNIAAMARWLAAPPTAGDSPVAGVSGALRAEDPPAEQILNDVRNMTEEDIKAFILQEMAKQ